VEASFELVSLREELRHARHGLRRWMRPRPVRMPLWAWPGKASLQPEPLGCVLILGAWNYPVQLSLLPAINALAAGNSVVIKPSEQAPRTAAVIARALRSGFPAEVLQVVLGDAAIAGRLLEERFDHILFTGNGRIGRLVMAAAARHLTPVTLELGGKSPAIVLADADPATTARRLLWGKGLNAGQTCIAPDYLLVVPELRQPLLEALTGELRRFYGDDPLRSADLARIVNDRAFRRLEHLLGPARQEGRILLGGRSDRDSRRFEPTLVQIIDPEQDPLMEEEIFGPILPLLEVNDLDDALAFVRGRDRPLALYLFSRSRAARRQLLQTSSSGGVAFNDVVIQGGMATLPFGGVGESGMGRYHGEAGFLTFSHQRAVVERSFRPEIPFRYPPYRGKLRWIQRLLG
jgi:aldehyde dehydrogenase (NAD+)